MERVNTILTITCLIFLLFPLTACGMPESDLDKLSEHWLIYHNSKYDYAISYPSNWILQESSLESLHISPSSGEFMGFNVLSFQLKDRGSHSVDYYATNYFNEVSAKSLGNIEIQNKGSTASHPWQWVQAYTDYFEGQKIKVFSYFKLADDTLYVSTLTWEYKQFAKGLDDNFLNDYLNDEMVDILDSFTLLPLDDKSQELEDSPSNFVTYRNNTYGYTFEYPSHWELYQEGEEEHGDIPGESLFSPYTDPYWGHIYVSPNIIYEPPMEVQVQESLEFEDKLHTAVYGSGITVLESKKMTNMWDWYTSYDYVDGATVYHEEEYWKLIGDTLCIVTTCGEKEHYGSYPFKEVVSSFRLLEE